MTHRHTLSLFCVCVVRDKRARERHMRVSLLRAEQQQQSPRGEMGERERATLVSPYTTCIPTIHSPTLDSISLSNDQSRDRGEGVKKGCILFSFQ